MPGPLSHLTILDLSRVLAGPWCTQLLADLGATVIKVERPGSGDDTRAWGPPYAKDPQGADTSESAYFLSCNRGKLSVAIDIAQPEGQALVRDLAQQADVFVENFKVGGLAAYGLDYATLARTNLRLVYASITGFGQQGPYAQRAGYDFIIQGMSGFMSVTGERDDLPGGGPQKAGVAITDMMTGMYASVAIMAALAHRERSGEGQRIDANLFDSAVAMMATMNMNYLTTGNAPVRAGNAHPSIVPYQVFACADGQVIVAVGNDGQFARFCEVAEKPGWADDDRFATNAARVRHRELLVEMIDAEMRKRTRAHWLAAFEAAQIPCGPINGIDQVFADPHVIARGLLFNLPHPLTDGVPQVGVPFRLPVSPPVYRRAPPLLAQHTRAILRERLARSDAQIDDLATRGVIQVRD